MFYKRWKLVIAGTSKYLLNVCRLLASNGLNLQVVNTGQGRSHQLVFTKAPSFQRKWKLLLL